MPGKNIVTTPGSSGRRLRTEEGPWAISAAETPHDPSSYSLYIKTPTHNLTLTRSAQEIVDLHAKLRDSFPGLKMPTPPIDAASLPAPPKRKSVFLKQLSRFASPSSNKTASSRQVSDRKELPQPPSSSVSSSTVSIAQTPIVTPTTEIGDPFAEIGENGEDISALAASNNKVITGLAAYLTTLANDTSMRQARAWKRFVRVRTDDLQSVRVERAIKRVRSDLAAHVSPGSGTEIQRSISQVVLDGDSSKASSVSEKESGEEKEEEVNGVGGKDRDSVDGADGEEGGDEGTAEGVEDRAPTPMSPKTPSATVDAKPAPATNGVADDEDDKGPRTPIQMETPARKQRSQSADPSTRTSRLYSSTPSTASQTGDDSSISTTERRSARKKRAKSRDPNSEKKSKRKVVIDDFEMMRVLGKGCAGKVLLVRHKPSQDVYALKAITKRHVLAHQELQHTLTEQAVLKRMAAENTDPFVVKLWWSFHDRENLFLVMDFHPGGDLATQLARWGRLGRDRARFYAAEIVEGVEGLHAAGVIYRDLKPENILIGADGHIVLTDFGLSKEFPRRSTALTAPSTPSGSRGEFLDNPPAPASPHWMKGDAANDRWTTNPNDTTSTFCGTAEYLAPEVIQGLPYSYEVDWWSFGTMLYEMLTGITPFWAENHSDMYYRVLQDELQFPEDRTMDQDTKSLIRGLLQRNPALRMKEPRIKKHPYFSMIDWSHVYYKRYIPPYIPPIDPSNASDTQNFDDTFLGMEPVINDQNEEGAETDADRTDGEDSATTPSQSRSPSVHPVEDDSVDVFDGYSFKGRHSVIIDDGDEDGDGEDEEDEEDEESISGPSLDDILPDSNTSEAAPKEEAEGLSVPEEIAEPKTPEARPSALPAEPVEPAEPAPPTPPEQKPEATPRSSHEQKEKDTAPTPTMSAAEAAAAAAAKRTAEDENVKTAPKVRLTKLARNRREKSGIPALDKDLPDTVTEDEGITEREDEDDWDFVEAGGMLVEERNGAKGTSLFARGVVDRYKLAVFRKSTPRRSGPRSVSGVSMESDLNGDPTASPSPSDKIRRGRTPGLTFRKNPKQFLRQKSPPPPSRSAKSFAASASASATLSAASTVSSAGFLTPSPSQTAMTPSLKSKESAISVGAPSESSDPSVNGDPAVDTIKGSPVPQTNGDRDRDEEKQQKNKVLKKYKEGAEKVLSIFQSPR